MIKPSDLPKPSDELQRIDAFARDLAWGVLKGEWTMPFVEGKGKISPKVGGEAFAEQVGKKWIDVPSFFILSVFGYAILYGTSTNTEVHYTLTKAAFELHRQVEHPPKVFISYKHNESSAFALLIEARLRIANAPTPFIDKNIPGGVDWEDHLKEQIESTDYFVCLVGQKTLDSKWIQAEIDMAVNHKRRIIAVCHNGKKLEDCPDYLTRPQGHCILEESAAHYESAVDFVLNSLNLPTY